MEWEGREALEHREANDRYFAMPEDEVKFVSDEDREAVGLEDGLAGTHSVGQGAAYERGWDRGNALRRLRNADRDPTS